MVRLLCHSVSQKADLYRIVPTKENIQEEYVLYVQNCVICGKPVLEINRLDIWGNKLEPVRLRTKNIQKFLDSMNVIWKPKKIYAINPAFSRFTLNYNEYGTLKKCCQNFSNLHIGKIETDPYKDLKNFKISDLLSEIFKIAV